MDSPNNLDVCDGFVGEANGVDSFSGEQASGEPSSGMFFSSVEEMKSFYKRYASNKGFEWKIRTSKKGEDGKLKYFMLSCSREGHRVSGVPCTLKTLPTKVKSCPAKMNYGILKSLSLTTLTQLAPLSQGHSS